MDNDDLAKLALKDNPDLMAIFVEVVHHRYSEDRRRERRRWIAGMGSLFLVILGGVVAAYVDLYNDYRSLNRDVDATQQQADAANIRLNAPNKDERPDASPPGVGESDQGTARVPLLQIGEPVELRMSGDTRTVRLSVDTTAEYSIVAASPTLDPLIVLMANGQTLAADDDSAGYFDADIRHRLESGQLYTVDVQDLKEQTGNVTLTLRMVIR